MSNICHVWYPTLSAAGFHWPLGVFLTSSPETPDQPSCISIQVAIQAPDQTLYGYKVILLLCYERLFNSTLMCLILLLKKKTEWPEQPFLLRDAFLKKNKKREKVVSQRIMSYACLFKKPLTKIWICTLTELNNENLKCLLGCCTTWQILHDCPRESWLIKRLGSEMNNHFTHIYAETQ